MSYFGTHISGHSGTDFKHKKAFENTDKIYLDKKSPKTIDVIPREKKTNTIYDSTIKRAVAISFCLIVFVLIYALIFRLGNIVEHTYTHSYSEFKEQEGKNQRETADMLYKSAQLYYESGALNNAQDEVSLVLKLYPRDKQAIILMNNILNEQCDRYEKFCTEAKIYEDYIKTTYTS